MTGSFLSRFDAVLFDLNGTLAGDFDRFGPEQDFYSTYRRLGGSGLAAQSVDRTVRESLARCLDRYRHGPWDPFPAYREFLNLNDPDEAGTIEDTVAEHELGVIPDDRLAWIADLAATHRIGVVSDIWAPARRLRAYLGESGLAHHLDAVVISSEEGAVKPSARLFETALARVRCAASRTLFVGDSLHRDIGGAQACGMTAVWVRGAGPTACASRADRAVATVEDICSLD